MHFEYLGRPADAARTVARLGGTPVTTKPTRDHDDRHSRGRKAPAFPLPDGHCFAIADGSPLCHDGHRAADRRHITDLQRQLIRHGLALGPSGTDGRFGSHTDRAVRAFQRADDLRVDGQVGPLTWRNAWLRDKA
jgi:eukaryotic-like serine/threonine-protein kinase